MNLIERKSVGSVVIAAGRRRTFREGETLFHEGDRSTQVYAVTTGRIRIYLTTPSGRELMLGIRQEGEEFGELSAIDERPRSASASAMVDSEVAIVQRAAFRELLDTRPSLYAAVCKNLSAQLRMANHRLVARNSDSATVRTGSMLVELSSLMMRHGGGGDEYELPITQSDLADWIGVTRESTARALAQFRTEGLVETSRGCITVCDVVALSDRIAAY